LKYFIVTSNKKKFFEFHKLLGNQIILAEFDLSELQTTNLRELVGDKLKQAYKKVNAPVFVEDSSLYFEAWNELPGPLIKWFIENIGLKGLVRALSPFENNLAYAKSCLGFTTDGKKNHFFEDNIKGKIVNPKGSKGFGWDTIFRPFGQKLTFGEMSLNQKLNISPRGKVTKNFKRFLELKAKQM
tara:strand:- start:318 stop:872 length:555 start_codon:yes stop_codon:yes gene_type:complete